MGKNKHAVALGKIKSPKKAESSRKNGALGGRPANAPDLYALRKQHFSELDRANKLADAGAHDRAGEIWERYLKISPNDPDILFNLGVVVQRRAKSPAERHEAAGYFDRVVSCQDATMERKADAMNNLGLLMETTGYTEKAAIAYGFALKMWPAHKAARINLGDALRFAGKFEEADKEYQEVIKLDSTSPEAHFCAGMIALLLGDYARGWQEYRWRFRVGTFSTKPFKTDKPKWEGEVLEGKTLILTEEQGFGDSFQFLRYAGEIKRLHPSARILFRCQPCLYDIALGFDGIDGTVPIGEEGEFDYHLPLMDCPAILGTTLATVPAPERYLRIHESWPRWSMQGSIDRKRVALVWAGSPLHGKDKHRSIPADAFQPIIDAHPEIDFYALQAGPQHGETEKLRGVTDLVPQIGNWTDTAQMLSCMHLLISVDTACAHLAGAVGTPCFGIIPHSPDFRWMLNRTDSPWYPKMRLFRMPTKEDHATPIQQINDALSTF